MPVFKFLSVALSSNALMSFDKKLLIDSAIYLVNICVLIFVLVKLLYNPVKKYMNDRSARIEEKIKHADNMKNEAEDLKNHYEQLISNIDKEREETLKKANAIAAERGKSIIEEAREEAEDIIQRAVAEAELEKQNATEEMKKQMIELSMLVASKFVEVSIDSDTQNKFIDEALSGWEAGIWQD